MFREREREIDKASQARSKHEIYRNQRRCRGHPDSDQRT